MIRLGFACKIVDCPQAKIRSCTIKNANKENLIDISNCNIDALSFMISYCSENNIELMRISSDIIPFASRQDISIDWQSIFSKKLKQVGDKIRQANLRISMHPGQYTVLNSLNRNVVISAISDISWHANFLDALNVDTSAKIVLHLGGVYNDKNASIMRFIQNFNLLPKNARSRIVLENDEKNYNIKDVLFVSKKLGIPTVFDVFHHSLNPQGNDKNIMHWITESAKTWTSKDGRQKIHYSQQKIGAQKGAHSDTIDTKIFMDFYKTISKLEIDIMLEVKDKNISALNCINVIKSII